LLHEPMMKSASETKKREAKFFWPHRKEPGEEILPAFSFMSLIKG